ncbi:MAG: PIG-L deacetylase family protein [Armatimonadota bacterium]
MNVLAIGAHPDDIELFCGGTLAKYAQAGHGVHFAVVCDGAGGVWGVPADEARRLREVESLNAASIIGASVHHLGWRNHRIPADDSAMLQLLEIIRRVDPTVVMTHAANDCFLDHQRTSRLVDDAVSLSTVRDIQTESPWLPHQPCLLFMDTTLGLSFHPNEYVDITGVIDVKRAMLECHRTQMSLVFDNPHEPSIMEIMEVSALFRGIQCGVRYAEAYRLEPRWDRTMIWRLLP